MAEVWDAARSDAAAAAALRAAAQATLRRFPRPVPPRHELRRRKAASALRSTLARAVAAAAREGGEGNGKVPPLAYERWAARDALRAAARASLASELLLPCSGEADAGLARDLARHALGAKAARDVTKQLAGAGRAAAERLAAANAAEEEEAEAEKVHCTPKGSMMAVALGAPERKPYFTVSPPHLDKLQTLYLRALLPGVCSGSAESAEQRFLRCLFVLLARYDAAGGAGYQCALPGKGFDALREALGASGECFASPLNCRTDAFCSAFPDVDAPFGSAGSFLDFAPARGSYEANPIFVPETCSAMVDHMERLLENAERRGCKKGGGDKGSGDALSFAVVVPHWEQCRFYSALCRSRFARGAPIHVAADDHVYVDGAQHTRPMAERERPSSYATSIAVLQTAAAARRWPLDGGRRAAIATALCASAGAGGERAKSKHLRGETRIEAIERRNKRRKRTG